MIECESNASMKIDPVTIADEIAAPEKLDVHESFSPSPSSSHRDASRLEIRSVKIVTNEGPLADDDCDGEARTTPGEDGLQSSTKDGADVPPAGDEVDESFARLSRGASCIEENADAHSQRPKEQPHPELEELFLINCDTLERIVPNSEPVVLDNDLFRGVVLMMVRTSDADEGGICNSTTIASTNDAFSNYFRTKKRRFEFQYQIKLKKVPEGPMFLSAELDEPVKLGHLQRAFVGACLNFVKKMNVGLHWNLDGSKGVSEDDLREGRYERTHLAFTVDASMDALVATKPGDPLPKLGEVIPEDPESLRYRKKGGRVDWNTRDTYTMGLWSAYVDFLQWRCLNFPGIRPFSISGVIGPQPVHLILYSLKEDKREHGSDVGKAGNSTRGKERQSKKNSAGPQHYQCNKEILTHLEFSHAETTSEGKYAEKWMAKHCDTALPQRWETCADTDNSSRANSTDDATNGEEAFSSDDSSHPPENDDPISEIPEEFSALVQDVAKTVVNDLGGAAAEIGEGIGVTKMVDGLGDVAAELVDVDVGKIVGDIGDAAAELGEGICYTSEDPVALSKDTDA